ncbi:MAG: ABC transporter permease subunit [Trueperaceae bacterium]|nr:ABC transporter permease subunit [Trueperaceae bacterium]
MSAPAAPPAISSSAHAASGDGPWPHVLLAWPTVALTVLFLVPLGIIAALGFFRRIQAGFFEVAFVTDNYARALDAFHLERLAVSVVLALAATLVTLLLAVPFTYLLTRRPRARQVPYLVLVLASLSLSEVIVAFAWSLLLSRTSGISNLLVAVGLMDRAASWSPGLAAVLLAYVFIALPLAILSLYPTFSRLDQELPEAAGTMGATPLAGFVTVVLPLVRRAVAATGALVFIFVLGAYVIPQTLGRPAQWTMPVHITDQAIMKNHLPLAASLAIVLLVVSSLVAVAIVALGAGRWPRLALPGRAR